MSGRLAAGAGLLLLLAACSTAPEDREPVPPAAPAAQVAPPPEPAPPAVPPAPAPPRDACGAYELQNLIGRPRTEVPVPIHPERQRVACTTCPITQDYDPARLNFFFDAQTGLIRQIRCG
ncbi:MAG TPA: peptidase inhibitor I78 [Phenylobacterium sp.]|uniref:peptidase inhibitor I78 n=1 Tax=Phenylobacterium sp. TaxID=1871053 RepID=UPI002BBEADBE|nr:peptidase inhibitor I78 [Phenylobacterium sp.]HSV03410.1 peptidase inhibitor I78 [Phenylobacterium sp.]